MPTLLFCMTPGVSLRTWKSQGTDQRELHFLRSLAYDGWKVKILTFRPESTKPYRLPDEISLVCFPHHYLLWCLPFVYRGLGASIDLIMTNQSLNAWHFTNAARVWKKPILLRCGYVRGERLEIVSGPGEHSHRYQRKESQAFREATMVEVTSPHLADWLQTRYQVDKGKIHVIPNYVDTDLFAPQENILPVARSVVNVGRLQPIKRHDLLLKACAAAQVSQVTIIGDGPERERLRSLANDLRLNLKLPGLIEHEKLPRILCEHQAFVIASFWEGHPKALIEAMACGLPCVGVESVGIRECICSTNGGVLTEATPEAISAALIEIFANSERRRQLGQRARQSIEATMSARVVFACKKELLQRCLMHGR
ncbi:MAG: glycosyltransferase family 4 protein [Chloroflexi bacterium]|nr:glycosyltransferase family 4 protein [Chloroflexota bacterium]